LSRRPRRHPRGRSDGATAPLDPEFRGPGRRRPARRGDRQHLEDGPGAGRGGLGPSNRRRQPAGKPTKPRQPSRLTTAFRRFNPMPLFDSEFLKKLEYLSLISKRVFRGSLMAQRRTMQLGSGIEFADHREYTAGDDFRYLDWNLYARHD